MSNFWLWRWGWSMNHRRSSRASQVSSRTLLVSSIPCVSPEERNYAAMRSVDGGRPLGGGEGCTAVATLYADGHSLRMSTF